MSRVLISPGSKKTSNTQSGEPVLRISEFFYDTIQGEGPYTGMPAAFLRVQGCTLNCVWCDTKAIWATGHGYSHREIFELIDKDGNRLISFFKNGGILVLTGGSPLKQQKELGLFIEAFIDKYHFKPEIHIENECTLMPGYPFAGYVDVWVSSPKLLNSKMSELRRYVPEVIQTISNFHKSWFKFVISTLSDWDEIEEHYIAPGLLRKDQVILMPEGISRSQVIANEKKVVDLAIQKGVRYSDRLHILLWNRRLSV